MSTSYKNFILAQKKAEFIRSLIEKSEGKLSQEDLQKIANYRWQLKQGDELVEDCDLISEDREILVSIYSDQGQFAKAAILVDHGLEHSWAGIRYTRSYGNWIIGDGEFGYSKDIEYSLNGESGTPDKEYFNPDFDTSKIQAIAIKIESYDAFNRNTTIDEVEWYVHILLPGKLEIDPVIAEIMEKFNL